MLCMGKGGWLEEAEVKNADQGTAGAMLKCLSCTL